MITGFTVSSAQIGSINILSIQSPVEVGTTGTIQLTYTSSVPCKLNTQLRETNPSATTVNWGPWHGQFDVINLPVAAAPTAVTVNYPVNGSEVVSANLPANVQYTFVFQLNPTAGGGGYGYNNATSANLVTVVPSSTVVNSVNISSVASTVAAGSDLVVNFNYTLANNGKVKVEVRKFDGTTYLASAGALVKDIYIDPVVATTGTPVTGSGTLSIPSGTIPSSLLTGNENYKVVVTIYDSNWGYIADKKSNITITASSLGIVENLKEQFTIYPNPVNDILMIGTNALSAKSITIIDVTGRTLKVVKNKENLKSIDVSDLKSGLYILIADNNQQYKFVKK
jgi:hypothetical protein